MSRSRVKMAESSTPHFSRFTLFPKLPIELRLKIWDLAMSEGRIIEVMWREDDEHYFTDSTPPILLQVCQESRQHALKRYEVLEFPLSSSIEEEEDIESENEDGEEVDSEVNGGEDAGDTSEEEVVENAIAPACAYIDYRRDTLYLTGSHLSRASEGGYLFEPSALDTFLHLISSDEEVAGKLQNIALCPDNTESRFVAMHLLGFKALRNLILVYDDECCYSLQPKKVVHKRAMCFEEAVYGKYLTKPWDKSNRLLVNRYRDGAVDFRKSLENDAKKFKKKFKLPNPGKVGEWANMKAVPKFLVREARNEDSDNADEAAGGKGAFDPFRGFWDSPDLTPSHDGDPEGIPCAPLKL